MKNKTRKAVLAVLALMLVVAPVSGEVLRVINPTADINQKLHITQIAQEFTANVQAQGLALPKGKKAEVLVLQAAQAVLTPAESEAGEPSTPWAYVDLGLYDPNCQGGNGGEPEDAHLVRVVPNASLTAEAGEPATEEVVLDLTPLFEGLSDLSLEQQKEIIKLLIKYNK